MSPGSKVKVVSDHRFHPNREGIILFFGEEDSSGIAVMQDLSLSKEVFAVKLSDLILLD